MRIGKVLGGGMLVLATILLVGLSVSMATNLLIPTKAVTANLPEKVFTIEELKKYDGTNPDLPIYLAYEGKVYDVSAGKQFYQNGGVYHFIAGRDATVELNIAGGGIIKRKYPIIGVLTR